MLFSVCLSVVLSVHGQEPSEQDLEQIQQQIKQTQEQLKEKQAQARRLEAQLREAEIAISTTAKALADTQADLNENQQKQAELAQQKQQLEQQIAQQQSQLAAQIKSAFMAGNYDYAKMLLNQQDAAKFERVLSYYQYVSEARRQSIEKFRIDISALEQVNQQLQNTIARLNELREQQQQQQKALASQQQSREATLSALNRSMETDAERVEQLQASAQALLDAIEQARERAEQQPTELDGLNHRKGQLAMPAEGRFRRLFGDRRQGSVRWTGVIIEGSEGSQISAIHQGRVLYADWLKGFGLVTIIDHGEGFMSVYGHSQALLTQPGDLVTAGQIIGLVGRSGGQDSPNLYFEIRHKGKALNPSAWLKWR
ncbi:murein hydrolase activator EnvC family protein [Alteromonas facilis]|uniref:murein hydrolase activator EnvC family protein n=1 Tax=Alteromonas facilis TaxID=2048004 RepID=UPI001F0CC770|nr:peptidoglycan DD-metalloendopeptidase family protein [Alteromonas facilis]